MAAIAIATLGILLVAARWAFAVSVEPQLSFNGELTTDEFIPIDDTCDLRFQLFDAEFDGDPVADAVETAAVRVVGGAFVFSTPAARINQGEQLPRWLAIAVRCSGDQDYTTLAPRLKHHTGEPAMADELQTKLQEYGALGSLVCGDPADIMNVAQDGSLTVWGLSYRLQGGFRQDSRR